MLLKHSAYYMLARGLPGVLNFLAIAIYTRMLSPDEYGRYALVIAGIGLFNAVLFQWLSIALSRFLPVYLENRKPLLSTILAGFSAMALLTVGLGLLLAWLWPDSTWREIILLAVPLLLAQAWFELNLTLSAIQLLPRRYGLMNGVRTVIALAAGVVLIMWGLGAYGPLLGLLLGMLIAGILWGRVEWKGLSLKINWPLLNKILHYGLPLTATFALGFIVSSSDRFLISWFLGESSAGIYAASYDLGGQTLSLLMLVVNLAAFPLAVRALELKGMGAAQEQLRQNAILLLAIAFPAAIGISVLAPNVSTVLLGASFREDATRLLPWAALTLLISGVRVYYFDLAFQLGRNTIVQVWVVGAAALLNFLLNLWWIPWIGLMGAAYASFAAYLLSILLSATLGRHVFPIPIPYKEGLKIALASLLMGVSLWHSREFMGFYALAAQVLLGGIVYLLLISSLNVGGYRTRLLQKLSACI